MSAGIVVVIGLNAVFTVVQEWQAQRAVHSLSAYLPATATLLRDGALCRVPAADLVPGDVLLVEEGDRVPADARLLQGALQLDISALSCESAPVERAASRQDPGGIAAGWHCRI